MRTRPDRARRGGLLISAGWLLLAGCGGAAGTREAARVEVGQDTLSGYLLATFTLDTAGHLLYELRLSECDRPECPLTVLLVEKGSVRQRLALDWPMVFEEPRQETHEAAVMGLGDPAADGAPVDTWVTGEEENAIAVAARLIDLDPGHKALLVQQSGGFERLRRRHYVVTRAESHLVRVWTGEEGEAPGWSMVDVADGADGGGHELLFWQFSGHEGSVIEWDLTALAWNADHRRLAPVQSLIRIYMGVIDGRRGTIDPYAFQQAYAACLVGFRPLSSPSPEIDDAVVAVISGRRSNVEAALARAQACDPRLEGQVMEISLPQARQ
jgi:hypothetical protein